jgi:hypothetical protein
MEYLVLLNNSGSVEKILRSEINDIGEATISSVHYGLDKPKSVSKLKELITWNNKRWNRP